ncbi:MAG: universal stress protein [Candidatus Neomarinimicrobiota bacterium]
MAETYTIRKILVTTDFSDYSKYAFTHAVAIAEKFKAELVVIHVIQPTITPADYAWVAPPTTLQSEHEKNCRESLEKLVSEVIPEGIKVDTLLAHGAPLREIIDTVRKKKIDLIVMATHGLGGLSHVLFGSTSEKVVRKSPCPVLTVRHPEHKFEMP